MFKTLRLIAEDLRQKAKWCYESESPGAMAKAALTDGTLAMVLYRLMQASRAHHMGVAEMVFNKLNTTFGGAIIGRGAEFGPGFVLIHANGVVINGNVKGGSNVFLEHQVTIGAERRQSPMIGSNVFIGAGAKIIGPVTIGDGARVGANAVVLHDVAADTTVVGIPAKPVRRRDAQDVKASFDEGITSKGGTS